MKRTFGLVAVIGLTWTCCCVLFFFEKDGKTCKMKLRMLVTPETLVTEGRYG